MKEFWTFIITWTLTVTVATSCPASGPDEFGRTSMITCAVYHSTTKKDTMQRKFTDRDSAFAFFKRLNSTNNASFYSITDKIRDRKIDSIKTIK